MIRARMNRIITGLLSLLIIIVLLTDLSMAGSGAGRNAASFLKIGQGARSAGLGGAYTAISEGAIAAYWNPAGLSSMESSEISLGHFAWFQDISVEQITFATPAFDNMVTAISVTYVDYGTIEGFDNTGMATGDLAAHDLAVGLSLGYTVTDDLSVGLTGKYISQRLDTYQATAYAADLGIKYVQNRFTVGAALSNVGNSLRFLEVDESLPQSIRLGVAYRPLGSTLASIELEHEKQGETFLRQGLEQSFSEKYFLRTGYDYVVGGTNQSLTSGLSVGAGMKLGGATVDYAYTPDYRSVSDNLHRFTVVFNFGKSVGDQFSKK